MIIIFLDVDGVLNHRECFAKLAAMKMSTIEALDDECIHRLKRIVDTFGHRKVEIVLSSSWRFSPDHVETLAYRLSLFGLQIHSKTTLKGEHRGAQIKEWLDENKSEDRRILILDDDSDMLDEQMPFFVKTSMETGLTDEHVEKAIAILKNGTNQPIRMIWTKEECQVVSVCKTCDEQTLKVGMFERSNGAWVRQCSKCGTFN
jgi:hypothetical protein